MGEGGGKQQQSVFPIFMFIFISLEPIHKHIYVLYVNRIHFIVHEFASIFGFSNNEI